VVYLDTSALVPLFVPESTSAALLDWYESIRADARVVSAFWCVTELASALGLKRRTGQITGEQAIAAWHRFSRFAEVDLQLMALQPEHFNDAAELILHPHADLRAGDALHLACARQAGAKSIATLDAAMARNAQRLGIKPVALAS
jgi:predicted nucleic acid-binding protein